MPLSIEAPKRAWDVLCMDFIGPLPRTARGHDAVMVVVDKLTRYAYYLEMRTTDSAQEVFALLNRHVLANHGDGQGPQRSLCCNHTAHTRA